MYFLILYKSESRQNIFEINSSSVIYRFVCFINDMFSLPTMLHQLAMTESKRKIFEQTTTPYDIERRKKEVDDYSHSLHL